MKKEGLAVLVIAALAGAVAMAAYVGDARPGCGAAVAVWMKRGDLPMPPLAAGPRDLMLRGSWFTSTETPPDLDGCERIELWREGAESRLVARYDVGWYGDPTRYRLVAAVDAARNRPLNVDWTPELTAGDLPGTHRGRYKYNPLD